MSQRQEKYIITAAFPEPNYTQTPNKFFEMLPDMEHSEVNVTLVLIRETFGYHRTGCKMGLNKLAGAAGLSRNAAKDGAEAAEKRGTFRRANPDSLGEAEWELVIGQPVTTHQPVTGGSQPVTNGWSTNDSQVGVKEIKENEINTGIATISKIYEQNIGAIFPKTREILLDIEKEYPAGWFEDAVVEAVKNNKRNLAYVDAILKRWKNEGRGFLKNGRGNPKNPLQTKQAANLAALQAMNFEE